MASRMDRYYSSNKTARSIKNKDLYKQVSDNDSSINTVDTISRVNEIDVNKIKDIINNREKYKKEKKIRQAISGSNIHIELEKEKDERYDILDLKPEKLTKEEVIEAKNYDVLEVINKAKDDVSDENSKNRNLRNLEYTDLNSLNLRKKEYSNSEAELRDLIEKINNTNKDSKMGDDVGLLDDLKSDTMIGKASSIKKVLDDEEKEKKKDDTKELDKSFFTSVYDFKEEDFDEAMLKKHKKKKNLIIMIVVALFVAIIISVLYFLGIFNFKIN